VELASIMSGEWLEESELSSDVIHLDLPSIPIQCIINGTPFDALYNPVVGINIMALSIFHQFIKNKSLSPTMKLLKCSSGQIIQSSGILYVLPVLVYDMPIHLSFHICDIKEFGSGRFYASSSNFVPALNSFLGFDHQYTVTFR
jgi:hypothetical protein